MIWVKKCFLAFEIIVFSAIQQKNITKYYMLQENSYGPEEIVHVTGVMAVTNP